MGVQAQTDRHALAQTDNKHSAASTRHYLQERSQSNASLTSGTTEETGRVGGRQKMNEILKRAWQLVIRILLVGRRGNQGVEVKHFGGVWDGHSDPARDKQLRHGRIRK